MQVDVLTSRQACFVRCRLKSFELLSEIADCNAVGKDAFLNTLSSEESLHHMESIAENALFDNISMSISLLCLIVFHVSTSVLIFCGVQTGKVRRFFLISIGLHMTLDFASAWVKLEIIGQSVDLVYTLLLTLGVAFFAWRTYDRLTPTCDVL